MSKKKRRCLFYALLLLFPLLGGAIVFYAQGWRLDWEAFGVQKIGAMYIKSFPQYATIHLNGKPMRNKSGILDHGTFIGGLFPKNYTLALTADGYLDWKEHISVKSSLVSEVKYAVLAPNTPVRVVSSSVENFWIVDQQPAIKNERGVLQRAGRKLGGSRVIGWTKNFQKILTEDETNKTYFINDISGGAPVITNLTLALENLGLRSSGFRNISIDPGNDNNVLLQTSNSISVFDITGGRITETEKSSSTITQFAASGSWFAWTTFDAKKNNSSLILHNRSFGTRLAEETLAEKNIRMDFRNNNELGILQNDGGFFIERIGEQSAEKTASDVKDFSFSPDEDSVALLENNSVEIFSFGSENNYWRFRLPDNDKIERLEWYWDGNHLFVIYPSEVRFLDLNDKSLENFPTIASGSPARYDEQSNALYFVKNKGLWSLTFTR